METVAQKPPIHTRPFDMASAKAGAPYCCRDGSEATVLKFDGRNERYPLVGMAGNDDEAITWSDNGKYRLGDSSDLDLVMLPLGEIDGKPVFAGDEIMDCECLTKVSATPGDHDFKYCSWPAPAKVYPETRMTPAELQHAIAINDQTVIGRCRAVANAALRHAIDVGQVITKEDHEAALVRLGDSLRPVADAARAERDMAVAEAVQSAVLNCLRKGVSNVEITADLAAIIAEVKP